MNKILFVCIHNSARSQMAEAFVNTSCSDDYVAYSAGLEPGKLNPYVVRVMSEVGIDISNNDTKSVDDILEAGIEFDYVVTVCDEANAERCPMFPGGGERLHWGFPDPSAMVGSEEDRMDDTRKVREAIRRKVVEWCRNTCAVSAIAS